MIEKYTTPGISGPEGTTFLPWSS